MSFGGPGGQWGAAGSAPSGSPYPPAGVPLHRRAGFLVPIVIVLVLIVTVGAAVGAVIVLGGGGDTPAAPGDETTDEPSDDPTDEPSDDPTDEPTDEPTEDLSPEPTDPSPPPPGAPRPVAQDAIIAYVTALATNDCPTQIGLLSQGALAAALQAQGLATPEELVAACQAAAPAQPNSDVQVVSLTPTLGNPDVDNEVTFDMVVSDGGVQATFTGVVVALENNAWKIVNGGAPI